MQDEYIKSSLSYEELYAQAEEKLFKSVRRSVRFFGELFIILIVCVAVFFLLLLYGIPQGPLGSVRNIIMWLLILVMLVCIIGMLSSLRAVIRCNYYYKGDLRRIQEKLTYSDIYMDIPASDEEKYNNPFKLIAAALKNKQKNT